MPFLVYEVYVFILQVLVLYIAFFSLCSILFPKSRIECFLSLFKLLYEMSAIFFYQWLCYPFQPLRKIHMFQDHLHIGVCSSLIFAFPLPAFCSCSSSCLFLFSLAQNLYLVDTSLVPLDFIRSFHENMGGPRGYGPYWYRGFRHFKCIPFETICTRYISYHLSSCFLEFPYRPMAPLVRILTYRSYHSDFLSFSIPPPPNPPFILMKTSAVTLWANGNPSHWCILNSLPIEAMDSCSK